MVKEILTNDQGKITGVSYFDAHDRLQEQPADLVIVSGDLTNFGGRDDAAKVIADVRRSCGRVLALPGNLDTADVIPYLEREGVALHGRGMLVDGIGIFGCGGSNITPFKTPTEFTEDEIYATLVRGYSEVRDVRPLLMICHPPPFETRCDRIVGGRAVGSTAARRFIEEFKPDVCISGHVHESVGTDTIGPTTILNAGPFKDGGYIVVRTADGKLDARLEFL